VGQKWEPLTRAPTETEAETPLPPPPAARPRFPCSGGRRRRGGIPAQTPETSPPPAQSSLYKQYTDAHRASHDPAAAPPRPIMPPFLLLLAALALAPCLCQSHGGGGFYDPARVTQISWRPRSPHILTSFLPTCPSSGHAVRARHLFADLRL
jgi:hypothetical protein